MQRSGKRDALDKDTSYVLSNICEGGSNDQVYQLIRQGGLVTASSIVCRVKDLQVIDKVIIAIHRMLNIASQYGTNLYSRAIMTFVAGGSADIIYNISTQSQYGAIAAKAAEIIQTHFGKMVDEWQNSMPDTPFIASAALAVDLKKILTCPDSCFVDYGESPYLEEDYYEPAEIEVQDMEIPLHVVDSFYYNHSHSFNEMDLCITEFSPAMKYCSQFNFLNL